MKTTAIVLAGGSGSRMNSKVKKQYLLLGEYPVLWYSLANGVFLEKPDGVRIRKDKRVAAAGKSSRMFEKLVAAGQRLIGVIRKNEGGANRDLERFAREIHKLCDRWER